MDDDIHVAFSADAQVATENRISQTYINGDRLEGEVFNGMRNGKGVYIWASGERYEGDFVDNQRTGKGILLWPNGQRYEGDFVAGRRTGRGILT